MNKEIEQRLRDVEAIFDVEFKDRNLLLQALTHCSYPNEDPTHPVGNYERMEFLGDAVIEIFVREMLYRKFPDEREGRLDEKRRAVVSGVVLGQIAHEMGLHAFIFASRGELRAIGENEKLRNYLCCCMFEAIIGALYLDQGFGPCRFVVDHFLNARLTALVAAWKDELTEWQEETQRRFGLTPDYRVLEESGPNRERTFRVGCHLKGICVADGVGLNKKDARKAAAKKARETITQWEGRIMEALKKDSAMRHSGRNGETT